MRMFRNNLYDGIIKFSKIWIYGAGNYASMAYSFLKNAGLRERIDSFIVTEVKEQENIDGILVRCVDDLVFDSSEENVILIAVSRTYEGACVQAVQERYCINILKFADFFVQDNDFIERLILMPDEKFMQNIIGETLLDTVMNFACEFDEKRIEIEQRIVQRNKDGINRNTIVLISGDMKPRIAKIIKALVKKNYDLVVLEYAYRNENIIKEIMTYDITFFHCKDLIEVFYRALQYNPLVYYYEPEWGDCRGSEIMIRHRKLFGKIAFAPYDVLNDGYVQITEKDKLSERYCLENADGVVWRWFSKEFLEERKGFSYKGKSIQFMDYCMGFELEENLKENKILKLCFVTGGISNELLINESMYDEFAGIYKILRRIGNMENCIFHVFVGICSDSDKEKLKELEKEYFNFKFYYRTAYNDLIYKITNYDYGCFFSTGGKDVPELETIDHMYYGSDSVNSEANRLFDYLDAGIPIIATRPKKQCEYFESLGVLVKMDLSNLDINYLKANRDFYRDNVKKAKTKLVIDNNIGRLMDFFNAL